MAWQGVPYPSFTSNTLDAGLTVTKIPELIVNTGFGWDNVVGSVIAALVGAALPTAIAWYTIKKNDNAAARERANQLADLNAARETQIRLAEMSFNAQVLSNNRQQWINNLRDSISSFISLLEVEVTLRSLYKIQSDPNQKDVGNRHDTFEKSLDTKRKLKSISTSVELLLNPTELTSKAILRCIRELMKMLGVEDTTVYFDPESESNKKFNKHIRSLKKVSQRCLKNEWKRVKAGH
ncbi:hypothetical protein EH203_14985 [Pectobacterium carotovorum subsp. carotovorum]|uniref:hypothetical protein n=1 Tax=Pectobacterium carotovorum TaxID=554 RepID=UPI0013745DC5|nr:hypothetical protein [Pectobacterium carotovorum]QHP55030.1 hypothetical protein EH203_14985 [Pectobacterium carotovorum subsp. carotovorum]